MTAWIATGVAVLLIALAVRDLYRMERASAAAADEVEQMRQRRLARLADDRLLYEVARDFEREHSR